MDLDFDIQGIFFFGRYLFESSTCCSDYVQGSASSLQYLLNYQYIDRVKSTKYSVLLLVLATSDHSSRTRLAVNMKEYSIRTTSLGRHNNVITRPSCIGASR